MRTTLALAEKDLLRALELCPKLVAAQDRLLSVAMGLGRRQHKYALMEAAAATCPLCFAVRTHFMYSITPRWGGSYAEMEAFAARSQARAHENPRLRFLLGRADLDRCDRFRADKKLGRALAACDRAVSTGDYAYYHLERAQVLRDLNRKPEALTACNRALELRPQLKKALGERAYLLLCANRFEEAAADVRLAIRLDPTDSHRTRRFDRLLDKMARIGHRHFRAQAYDRAIQAYNRLLAIHPAYPDALVWRGVARARKGDTAGGMQDLNLAVKIAPDNFDACMQLDHQLAARRRFDVVVGHWDRFLALRPDHGRAHFERGGAYYNQGKFTEALRDAKAACRLGYDQGCKLVQYMEAKAR
jgi:tetratricopeptide (TPR) repeat protein